MNLNIKIMARESVKILQGKLDVESLKQSFVKLNPRMMIKNPIMFTVEVATVVMLLVTLYSLSLIHI